MVSTTLQVYLNEQGYLKENSVFKHQVDFLNRCLEDSAPSSIEAAKALLDSICKTILDERGHVPESTNPTTMELVKASLIVVGIRQEEQGEQVQRIIKSLTNICEACSTLRNDTCTIAHGRSDNTDLTFHYFDDFVVETMNQVGLVLLRAHHGIEIDWKHTKRPFEHSLPINTVMDKSINIEQDSETASVVLNHDLIGYIEARPSEILYHIDREAWLTMKDGISEEDLSPEVDSNEDSNIT